MESLEPTAAEMGLDLRKLIVGSLAAADFCRRTGNNPSGFTDWPGTLAAVAKRALAAEAELASLRRGREWDPSANHPCGDCGVAEGELHESGCDREICPFCLRQLISCGCSCLHFYPNYRFLAEPFCNLPEEVYRNGLPPDQEAEWERLLEAKGRIPHMVMPNLCARCGQTWPDMFHADDWDDVVPADARGEMLCLPCYRAVKAFVLAGRAAP